MLLVHRDRKTRRGGKGVINIKTTDRNGKVVALKSVIDTDELMIISAKGIALRTDLSQLREIGRATQGVRLIRLEEGDEVVAVAKIVKDHGVDMWEVFFLVHVGRGEATGAIDPQALKRAIADKLGRTYANR